MKVGTFWLLVIVVVFLVLATYQLRELPGEWFGDISILHEEVVDILQNPFDWKFNLSAGPVYHHLVAMLAAWLGARYETYKVASVVAGVAGLVLTYFMGKELFGWRVSLWGVALMASSFWYLVWARLGSSPQSLSPVLVAGSGWLMWRWWREGKWGWLVGAEIVASLAWWSYPALYMLPLVPVVVVGWKLITDYRLRMTDRNIWCSVVGAMAVLLMGLGLFGLTIRNQPSLFASGYIGEKVFGYGSETRDQKPNAGMILKTVSNLSEQFRLFVDKGDSSFRTNVSGQPQVNWLTTVLFVLGWGVVFLKKVSKVSEVSRVSKEDRVSGVKNVSGWLLLVVFILLILPSSAPSILPGEIPSSARTFGVTPYVFLLAGLGLQWLVNKGQFLTKGTRFTRLPVGVVVGVVLVGVVGALNIGQYFGIYAKQLPNYNSPYGLYVAEWLDTLPETAVVKLAGCCWGEAGQPEPKGIYYVMEKQLGRENMVHDYPFVHSCDDFEAGVDYAVVFDPRDTVLIERLAACFDLTVQAGFEDSYGQVTFVGVRGTITQN